VKYILLCRQSIIGRTDEAVGPFEDATAAWEFARKVWKDHGHHALGKEAGERMFPTLTGLNGNSHFVIPLQEPI